MTCGCGNPECGWTINVLDGSLEVCERGGEKFENIFFRLDPNTAVALIAALRRYLDEVAA